MELDDEDDEEEPKVPKQKDGDEHSNADFGLSNFFGFNKKK